MNREDIIRMSQEAGPLVSTPFDVWRDRFAVLVAAHEREQCAKLCESYTTQYDYDRNDSCELLADAIRDNRWGKPWVG
jgi:hypothetical protein